MPLRAAGLVSSAAVARSELAFSAKAKRGSAADSAAADSAVPHSLYAAAGPPMSLGAPTHGGSLGQLRLGPTADNDDEVDADVDGGLVPVPQLYQVPSAVVLVHGGAVAEVKVRPKLPKLH